MTREEIEAAILKIPNDSKVILLLKNGVVPTRDVHGEHWVKELPKGTIVLGVPLLDCITYIRLED